MAARTPNKNAALFCGLQVVLKLKKMIHWELAFTFLLRAIKAISNGFDVIPTFLCACLTTLSHDSCGEQP